MIYQKLKPFPSGFLWGASTSAYQVEGGVDEDGKSPSIIDMYEHPEGVADFSVASDHYHRYKESFLSPVPDSAARSADYSLQNALPVHPADVNLLLSIHRTIHRFCDIQHQSRPGSGTDPKVLLPKYVPEVTAEAAGGVPFLQH